MVNEEDMNLNQHLAEKVMGWTVMQPSGVIVFANNQRSGMKLPDFDPKNNIGQAIECLNTFEKWQIRKNPIKKGTWSVMINDGANHVGNNLEWMISLACAMEAGYE